MHWLFHATTGGTNGFGQRASLQLVRLQVRRLIAEEV
jgi:hypothetical protein